MPDILAGAPFDWSAWLSSLGWIMAFAFIGWCISLLRRDVSHVDSMWSLMFLIAVLVYTSTAETLGWRAPLVLIMVAFWAIRLSAHITWRNHGQPEDHRYRAIRRNNEPYFHFKSLYIIFGLQGLLAWLICVPAMVSVSGQTSVGILDIFGLLFWLTGMVFETVADAQLARFRARPNSNGAVLNTGLWRYSRHPNYFGEFMVWWGFFLIAWNAGGGWTVFAPSLMSFLLLRVSGVALLEKSIGQRRPAYREYIRTTNAFFPFMPRPSRNRPEGEQG